jgi:hypothetical protein
MAFRPYVIRGATFLAMPKIINKIRQGETAAQGSGGCMRASGVQSSCRCNFYRRGEQRRLFLQRSVHAHKKRELHFGAVLQYLLHRNRQRNVAADFIKNQGRLILKTSEECAGIGLIIHR